MKLKRAHWEPTEHSTVCSEHFKEEDFTNRFSEDLYVCVSADHPYSQPEGWITKGAAQRDQPNAYESRLWLVLVHMLALIMSLYNLKHT